MYDPAGWASYCLEDEAVTQRVQGLKNVVFTSGVKSAAPRLWEQERQELNARH
jgi:hypothetical protein